MRVLKLAFVLAVLLMLARQYPDYFPAFDKVIANTVEHTLLLAFDRAPSATAQR